MKRIPVINENYQVTFSPTIEQLGEIETWLIAEQNKTGEGFYCNWNIIKSSYEKHELVTISNKAKTIGFATWWITSGKTAKIEIAEVKLSQRKKGVGKVLIAELLNYLKNKGIYVVDLQCVPESSEPVWKKLGFIEFPDPPENCNFNVCENKKLYKILIESLDPNSSRFSNESIELWNDEPYATIENTLPTYFWNIEFVEGTRRLLKPIIHPGHYDWRLRWRNNGKSIIDRKVKYFLGEIYFEKFIIIDDLSF